MYFYFPCEYFSNVNKKLVQLAMLIKRNATSGMGNTRNPWQQGPSLEAIPSFRYFVSQTCTPCQAGQLVAQLRLVSETSNIVFWRLCTHYCLRHPQRFLDYRRGSFKLDWCLLNYCTLFLEWPCSVCWLAETAWSNDHVEVQYQVLMNFTKQLRWFAIRWHAPSHWLFSSWFDRKQQLRDFAFSSKI